MKASHGCQKLRLAASQPLRLGIVLPLPFDVERAVFQTRVDFYGAANLCLMSIIYMVFFISSVNSQAQLMFGIRKSPNEPKRTRVLALWHVAGCEARYNARPSRLPIQAHNHRF